MVMIMFDGNDDDDDCDNDEYKADAGRDENETLGMCSFDAWTAFVTFTR